MYYQLRKIGIPASVVKVRNVYKLTSGTTIIGRGQAVDIFLDSNIRKGLISRAHAQIIRTVGENGEPVFSIFDTSLNGTYVNDVRVKGSVVLKEGDNVAFGHLCGSKILPGASGPQKETELLFRFEKCLHPGGKKEDLAVQLERELNNNSSSVFMSPKSPLCENGSSLPGLNHVSLSNDLEPTKKKRKCSAIDSGCENIDQKVYMDEEIDLKNVIDTAIANIKSDGNTTNDDDSFLEDLDSKVGGVVSEQTVHSSAPAKLVHDINNEIPQLTVNVNVSVNGSNLMQLNGPHKPEKTRNKVGKVTNEEVDDLEIESESESEYDDSDSDSEKSEEIPDNSSDNEHCSRGKIYAKRKLVSLLTQMPTKLKEPQTNVLHKSLTQGTVKVNNRNINRRTSDKSDAQAISRKDNKNKKNKKNDKGAMKGFTHDECDAPKCKIPSGSLKTITWIQCDNCDAWYHVSCSGLSVAEAKRKDTVFQCGCI